MGSVVTISIFLALIAYGYKLFLFDAKEQEVHLHGTVAKGFEKVREVFKLNLAENWERGGGAFAVYYKGELVVDLWGGYSDKESGRLWREDTMNIAFSTTKAVAALCIGKLVDEKRIDWDESVGKYWSEFGRNGKENITVRMVMAHRSGLAFTDIPIDLDTAKDHRAISKLFEEQTPNWPAGQATGYHAVTYGWLVDQLIRRTDPKKRSVGQYFKEEIADKHSIDFHIGLPTTETYRVARLKAPTKWQIFEEFLHAPENINLPSTFIFIKQILTGGMMMKVSHTVPWIQFVNEITLNNPDLFMVEQAAVLGIGVTRDVARLFEKWRRGEIMSKGAVNSMIVDYTTETDMVTGATVPRGQGLMLQRFMKHNTTYKLYGHAGYGGQNAKVDFENEISLAYMSNHLKVGLGDTARTYIRLVEALYDSVKEIKS